MAAHPLCRGEVGALGDPVAHWGDSHPRRQQSRLSAVGPQALAFRCREISSGAGLTLDLV